MDSNWNWIQTIKSVIQFNCYKSIGIHWGSRRRGCSLARCQYTQFTRRCHDWRLATRTQTNNKRRLPFARVCGGGGGGSAGIQSRNQTFYWSIHLPTRNATNKRNRIEYSFLHNLAFVRNEKYIFIKSIINKIMWTARRNRGDRAPTSGNFLFTFGARSTCRRTVQNREIVYLINGTII